MKIVQATPQRVEDNLSIMLKIEMSCFGAMCWHRDNFIMDRPDKFELSLLAMEEDEVQGYLIAYLSSETVCHISRLAVSPEYQGKKIATSLVRELEKNLMSLGIKKITVEYPGEQLKPFYEAMGYSRMLDETLEEYLEEMGKKYKKKWYLSDDPMRFVAYKTI